MKMSDTKKPVKTIPNGVWESEKPHKSDTKSHGNNVTDLQGNGYPNAVSTGKTN